MRATSIPLHLLEHRAGGPPGPAPPPTMPTLSGSLMRGSTVSALASSRRSSSGAGIIRRQDLAVVLPRPRAADRTPLAEPYSVALPPPSATRRTSWRPPRETLKVNALLRRMSPSVVRRTRRTRAVYLDLGICEAATASWPTRPDGVRPATERPAARPPRRETRGLRAVRGARVAGGPRRSILPASESGARCCSRPRRPDQSATERRYGRSAARNTSVPSAVVPPQVE